MTIHPPVLFTGFSSLVVPFAIAMAALVRREYDGWIKLALPWVVLSTAVLATGFIMGGVWAYKVLGWGGYWGWDPVENGSFIPWLSNIGPAPRPARAARHREPPAHELLPRGHLVRARALRLVPHPQRRARGLLGALVRQPRAQRVPARRSCS